MLDDGSSVIAHCTNSGSMISCLEEGAEVWLSPADDPKRKTQYTWEMIKIGGKWVGVNTSNPNILALEWISGGMVPGLEGLSGLRREVKWEDSRFDLYGEMAGEKSAGGPEQKCFIEVKNVTLKEGERALFPDAVTERGRKHLNTLIRVRKAGMRAVMLYVVQRMDVRIFSPARSIDPEYGKALDQALRQGVEIIVVQARVTPQGIDYHRVLPVEL
jgi:sugar fermentation stimulation protein A